MSEEATGMEGGFELRHGSFCWTEIASSDSVKAIEFYRNVFGWNFKDSDATDGSFAYHEYSTGTDYPSGGLYQITAEMCAPGETLPPPHFMTYIAVDDVDANATRAVELGASIVRQPMDIPNTGRFAVIQDPTGAVFSIFNSQCKGGTE